MFEQSFKNIDNILHTDSGCGTELDYVEQTSWVLFLKYLDGLEETKRTEAALAGKEYKYILSPEYQWNIWACPKNDEGKLDHNKALDGDDLKDFVNNNLFPYLKKFRAEDPNTIEYKIGEIFHELKNKISSGYKLREILKIVAPKISETIYDGACGSAGFLVESFNYLTQNQSKLSSSQISILQNKTFYGKEIKSLAYIIGIMNMILHGIEAPNIRHMNTLAENINDIQEKDRYDIVLANPPFGAGIGREIQQNFPIKTGETAFLFLQHFIKILKAGGRAGIVIKNTFLSNTDNASVSLRKLLLENCNLHTVLDLPGGVFAGAGVKTVVLFFEKGKPTKKVWFYSLNLGRNLGKGNPLSEADLAEFVKLQKTQADSDNSWSVDVSKVDQTAFDLSVKNQNKKDEVALREPKEIISEMQKLDAEIKSSILGIKDLL